jgi:hypothetical protein
VRWWRRAADQGDAEARYHLAVAHEFGMGAPRDAAEAVRLLRLAAEQGHASAQVDLAKRYASGSDVPRDDAEAVRLLRLGVEQRHPEGELALGDLYALGRGVTRDAGEAARWYRRAAESGYAPAMIKLGQYYERGGGEAANPTCAYFWYALAVREGWLGAERLRDALAPRLSPAQLAEGQRLLAGSVIESGDVQHPACPGDTVSLRLLDAELGEVLATFEHMTGLDVTGDYDFQKRVKVELEERPWEEALTFTLRQAGLRWRRSGDQIVVERAGGD